jgi:hypothetical protein
MKEDQDNDFQEFQAPESEERVPRRLSEKVFQTIHSKLSPSFLQVFSKMMILQSGLGALTLLVCPQFEVAVLSHAGIFHILNHIHPLICIAACGAFFVGVSAAASAFFLSWDEIQAIRKWKMAPLPVLGALALMSFHFLGATIVWIEALVWLMAAALAGWVLFEMTWKIRFRQNRFNF